MLRIADQKLQHSTVAYLLERQKKIDSLQSVAKQAEKAKTLWNTKNSGKVGKAAIIDIRKTLGRMAGALQRCMYSEDSAADEIEHHHPKDLFPKLTFVWSNHLFACGPCNGPKNNKFATVHADGSLFNVKNASQIGREIPIPITPALVDPRTENPLDFLWLDIQDTFEFVPACLAGTLEYTRGAYTIEVLRLNIRDVLVAARRNAYSSFAARLADYDAQKQQGAARAVLERAKQELIAAPHLTVWLEMQRQQRAIPRLTGLFNRNPEALTWKRL
jgi:hypothetical protein